MIFLDGQGAHRERPALAQARGPVLAPFPTPAPHLVPHLLHRPVLTLLPLLLLLLPLVLTSGLLLELLSSGVHEQCAHG
nr:hypothetical protein OG409_08910 [Streptomyces sp. NBC_00974]